MQRAVGILVVLAAVLVTVGLPMQALASQIRGQPIQMDGMDDATATIWSFGTGNLGRLLVAGGLAGAVGTAMRGYYGAAAGTGGASVAGVFIPSTSTRLMDAAPGWDAGPLTALPSLLQQMWSGVLGDRLQVDPVFLVILVSVGLVVALRHRRPVLH